MKKLLIRATAVALSIFTFASTMPVGALYRGVLGEVYYVKSAQIGAGVDYTEYRSVTDGLNERAYVFEYRAGEGAFPIVSYGDKLTGSTKVNNLAKGEAENGNNIVGGVNGDFFSIQTGIPMGTAIRDGRLLTDDDNNNAVGFTYDGETIFGNPEITFKVSHTYEKSEELTEEDTVEEETIKEESSEETDIEYNEDISEDNIEDEISTDQASEQVSEVSTSEAETYVEIIDGVEYVTEVLPVSYFNKYPTEWGAYLLDDMFSDSTHSKKESLEIVIKLDDEEAYAKIGETITGEISRIRRNSTDTKLKKGELIIVVCETSSYRSAYENIEVGNKITIEFSAAEGWENVESAIGGSDVFIKDGVIDETVINDSHEKIANPRTAVGVRPDGTVLIFAADGRQDISYGFRMISLARTLLSFGCVYALNLDGGGSTTAVVKMPGADETQVVSSPSDKVARSVSNALLLVDNTEPDNSARYIIPENASPIILSGESYTFDDIKFCDASLTEVIFSEDEDKNQEIIDRLKENLEIKFDKSRLYYYRDTEMPNLGTISGKNVYIADGESGEIPLLLTSEYGEYNVSGRALLFVANSPDEIIAKLESNIFAGTAGFNINFDSYYMGNRVPSSVKQVGFELTDDIIITAHEGETDAAIAECSIGYIDEAGGFVPHSDADGSAILTISLNGKKVASSRIIVGKGVLPIMGELELNYEFPFVEIDDTEAEVELHDETELDEITEEVTSEDDAESESTEAVTEIETVDTDVEEVTEELSTDIEEALSEEAVIHTGDIVIEQEFDLFGVKSLDLYASETDLVMYAVIESDEDELRVDYVLQNRPDNDGIFHYRAEIGEIGDKLISALSIDAHENGEKSGSLKIQNISVAFSDTETVFYDTADHWARQNINALYRMKIVGGEESGGKTVFSPERSLSRAEFAVMMSRALEYELENYTEAPDFADLDEIPEWALPHIRAVSENGLMNGKRMNDGSLNFDYSGKITRQEIMQVIGNLIKSLEEPVEDEIFEEIFIEDESDADEDTGIADIADVADWAYENVLLTLDSKIITGYNDNTIRPLNNVTRAEAATIILRTVNTFDLQK